MKKRISISLYFLFAVSSFIFSQTYPGNMVEITGGIFTMGNNNPPPMFDDQDPEHSVTISTFSIGETEVSNAHFVLFLNEMVQEEKLTVEEGVPGDWSSDSIDIANGHAWNIMADSSLSGVWAGQVLIKLSNIAGGGQDSLNRCWIEWDSISNVYSVVEGYENWPAAWVNWYGAMMYVDYYGLSIPTEAEWEYAARGGQQLEYPTNDGSISYSQANYGSFGPVNDPDFLPYPSPVGELFPPNPFGLYNMTGNVSEWCLDWYDADFYQTSIDSNYCCDPINTVVPSGFQAKVLRGGNHTYPSAFAMSSHRFDTPPFVTTDHMGFRVVDRETTTGFYEVPSSKSLKIYPNPAANKQIQISLNKGYETMLEVKIYDSIGRIRLSEKIANNELINLTGFTKGMYFVTVKVAGESFEQKLLVVD